MARVVLAENPADPSTWEQHDVADLSEFLASRYPAFPPTARIYHGDVAVSCDVTPQDEAGIARLAELPGPFYVVVYPAGRVGATAWHWTKEVGKFIGLNIMTVGGYSLYLLGKELMYRLRKWLTPDLPGQKTPSSDSPNNELADRKNTARPLARIPDIFGKVRSYPDLLTAPYKFIEATDASGAALTYHRDVEIAFMCVGRGAYEIEPVVDRFGTRTSNFDIRDGSALVSSVLGVFLEVYGPSSGPPLVGVAGATPQVRIGGAITEPLYSAKRIEAVDGMVLPSPNRKLVVTGAYAGGGVAFQAGNRIVLAPNGTYGFEGYFGVGDRVTISEAADVPVRGATGKYYWMVNSMLGWEAFDGPYTTEYGTTPVLAPGTATGETHVATGWVHYIALGMEYWVHVENGTFQWAFDIIGYASLNGTYEVAAGSTNRTLVVVVPPGAPQAAAWASLPSHPNGEPSPWDYVNATFSADNTRWMGGKDNAGVFVDAAGAKSLLLNFVAPTGLYQLKYSDKGDVTQEVFNTVVKIEVTPVEANGTSIRGDAEVFGGEEITDPVQKALYTVIGSDKTKTMRGLTVRITPAKAGPWLVRAARSTQHPDKFDGADEVHWRDLYAMKPVTLAERIAFGNITTVYAVTHATQSALAVKERRLNMLVTRKVKRRGVTSFTTVDPAQAVNGIAVTTTGSCSLDADGFSQVEVGTAQADDIFVAICRDTKLGALPLASLDLDAIYGAIDEARSEVFRHPRATEFSFTFDKNETSFEEMAAAVAQAAFCSAYRTGSQIRLVLERATPNSTLLLCHRNKVPGTETRTVSFGTPEGWDGVEFEYVDPVDDKVATLRIPESASNARKIQSAGIRNRLQAYFHANRARNKLLYQHVAAEAEVTEEAGLLVVNDRVLWADNTRPDTQDGDVVSQNVLELTLSQDVTFENGKTYTIFLQHFDGTVESMAVSRPGGSPPANVVQLALAPRLPLTLDTGAAARATYQIVADDDPRERAFLVTETEPQARFTTIVRAVNYDDRYYQSDADYGNGIVDEDGYLIGGDSAETGRFVATCPGGDVGGPMAAISYDYGITWEARSLPAECAGCGGLAAGSGLLVAGGGSYYQHATGSHAYSTDHGETWSGASSSDFLAYDTTFDGNVFAVVGMDLNLRQRPQGDGGRVKLSTNGSEWGTGTLPAVPYDGNMQYLAAWGGIAGSDGRLVAVNETSNIAALSINGGATWGARQLPAVGNWVSVAAGPNGSFMALAQATWDGQGTFGAVSLSSDGGETWGALVELGGGDVSWYRIIYFNGRWYAFANGVGTYATAPAAQPGAWTLGSLPVAAGGWGTAVGNGRLVLTGHNSAVALVTEDGVSWTQHALPAQRYAWAVAFIPDV